MSVIIRRSTWSSSHKSINYLNYPSFIAVLSNDTRYLVAQNFIVTNIGNDIAVYQSHVENVPNGMRIGVVPETLTFTHKNQKQGFVVSIN
ncbi:subtilisin-like protease sbt1.6 [Quercus suber]|uniref:Subtilisin-like protease sbt1.6 n=1 Tax=Quercus suber TaxID=58331 RepID=A0AAW0L9A1_QUESU